jgi:bacterioferritin-associated ferredoxin
VSMDHTLDSPEMVIVGLGASGRAALEAARFVGVNAIGLDRGTHRHAVTARHCHYGMRVWGIFGDGTVVIASETDHYRIKPKAIVVATGSLDLPLPIPGWQRDRVSGIHHGARSLPDGEKVVVLRGPHADLGNRAADLSRFDVLADYHLTHGGPVTIVGSDRAEAVTIGEARHLTGHVLLDNGVQPENNLARMTGLPTHFSTPAGGDVVVSGSVMAADGTLLSVVGDAAGIHPDRDATILMASETGRILAESLLDGRVPALAVRERFDWSRGSAPVLPAQVTDDTLVCPQEGITVKVVRDAIERGAMNVNDVKRRTRAGMATCQGRDCLWTIRALLAEAGRDWETAMTARPPAVGITLEELATGATLSH